MSPGIFDQSVVSGSVNRIVSAYISASYTRKAHAWRPIQPELTLSATPAPLAVVPRTLALGCLPHRFMDHVPVVPLRLTLQVLEHLPVLAVHVRAVRILPVRLLALQDHAQPDLARILCAAEGRVVHPARGRVILKRAHVLHELLGVPGLDPISSDRPKHLTSPPGELLRS